MASICSQPIAHSYPHASIVELGFQFPKPPPSSDASMFGCAARFNLSATDVPASMNGGPEWAPLALKMGNLRSLKREPSGARRCSLWCQTSRSLVTDCCHTSSENGHPYVARTLWSWDLATPGSERASSRLDLARKLLTAVPKIPLLWLHLRPSGVRIDFIGTISCNLPS
jgi:hypothetical protein